METTPAIKQIYSDIQNKLFYMIPEKWDKLYLYAAITERMKVTTGEMFFYYFPKGILKKKMVNVYEIPAKFNIEEDRYSNLINELYQTIRLLREEWIKTQKKPWTNLTISIENCKFKIEYGYGKIELSEQTSIERHIGWKHQYLGTSFNSLTKKEQKMVEQYLEQREQEQIEEDIQPMYQNPVHNVIDFEKPEEVPYQKEEKKDGMIVVAEEKKRKKKIKNKTKESIEQEVIHNQILFGKK